MTEHIDEYPPEDNGSPDDLLEVSDNEGPNHFNISCKNTDHSDLQVDCPAKINFKFKCSYGCDFSTFSIEEYMEHFKDKSLCVLNQKDKFTDQQIETTTKYVSAKYVIYVFIYFLNITIHYHFISSLCKYS